MLLRTIFALLGTIALSGTIHAGVLTSLLSIESASGRVGASVDLAVLLDNGSGDLQGWSFGVCHDPASLTLTALLAGSTALSGNNGEPASFLQLSEEPGGYTAGVVVCLTGCANLPIGNGYELTVGSYTIDGAVGTTTDVCPCSTLGSPSVATVLVIGGSSAPASLACGTVEAIPLPLEVQFVRGDANDDGAVDIGDGIWMLAELFLQGTSLDCQAAKDANFDGGFNTADPITILNYQFIAGPPPAAPFPFCGSGGVGADCQERESCAGAAPAQ